jgi:DNA-directed RNA polymerase alpha subunit
MGTGASRQYYIPDDAVIMLDPSPELPDNTSVSDVKLPTRIRNALAAAGITTIGEVRETSDATLLSFQDFGTKSAAYLRETLGLSRVSPIRP